MLLSPNEALPADSVNIGHCHCLYSICIYQYENIIDWKTFEQIWEAWFEVDILVVENK